MDPTDDRDGSATTLTSGEHPEPSDPNADTLVTAEHPGRYRVNQAIGHGSQSTVYAATDTHLGREVAVKLPAVGAGPVALQRFLREARIAAQLEHPNIVPVYEIGRQADGTIYCVQKLVRPATGTARTLREALRETKSLDDRLKLLNTFIGVCQGVAYAHSRGVLHRDLKPENVVVGRFGETVVLDWGLARAEGGQTDGASSQGTVLPVDDLSTIEGFAYGTPAYMSPEQARGETDVDFRTDLWSLGVMLFELLAGRLPFQSGNSVETIALVRGAPVPKVRAASKEVPAELAAIVDRALQRDPASRYASATALADDVIAWQNGHRVQVYEYGPFELFKLFIQRNRVASAIGFASLLAVLAAGTVATQKYFEARHALSLAHLEKARDAERALQWDKAAALYQQALAEDDNDETRWGVRLTGRRNPPPVERLVGQPGPVRALAFTVDGKTLAAGASDGTVYLWDVATKTRAGAMKAHARDITGLSMSSDGKWLATSSEDGSARVFSTDGWREETPLAAGRKDMINAVAFSPRVDAIAFGSEDGHVSVLSWPSRALLYEASEPSTGTLDSTLAPVYALAWSKAGALAWGTWRGHIFVVSFDADGKPSQRTLVGHIGAVLTLDFAPDGETLISAGRDGSVRVWSLKSGEVVHSFEGHTQKVYAARLAPGGYLIASGSTDRTLRLWDRVGKQPMVGASFNDGEDIHAVAWSPQGDRLAWAGTSGDVRLRPVPQPSTLGTAEARVYVVETSPDGRWLLASLARGVAVWDVSTRERVAVHAAVPGLVSDATFMGDGRVVWTCEAEAVCVAARDGSGEMRRFAQPEELHSVEGDGAWLAVGTVSGAVRVLDAATGAVRWESRQHENLVWDLARSPDGKTLASGSYDKTARLWNAADGRELHVLKGHTHGVRRVAFSPDGRVLATSSWDTTVRFWDVATGAELAKGARHEDHVLALAWAPSGRWVVTGGWDGTLRVWDPRDGRELGRAVADVDRVMGLAVDRDEKGLWYSGFELHRLDFHQP